MRRLALMVPVFALTLGGCKKVDELERQLAETRNQLTATQADLDAEKKKTAELESENKTLRDRIAELEGELKQMSSQIDDLANKAGATAAELAELRAEKAKRERELQAYRDLMNQLRALVDAGTVKINFRKGRMVVEMSSGILFDSGSTKLKEEGQAALVQLGKALGSLPDREFIVAGHTDNVPIKTARFRNNWDLSTARSIEVVDFLTKNGVSTTQLGAAGYGEFDPVGDNATEEGRANNRRIEIIVMPNLGSIPGMQEMLTGKKGPS